MHAGMESWLAYRELLTSRMCCYWLEQCPTTCSQSYTSSTTSGTRTEHTSYTALYPNQQYFTIIIRTMHIHIVVEPMHIRTYIRFLPFSQYFTSIIIVAIL